MAYPREIKASNISENWLFQLTYFNNDANGDGGGGFDKVYLSDGTTANLLREALDDSETAVDVDEENVFEVGDHIKVDNEIMRVTSLPTDNVITVIRGAKGTTPATHNDNSNIYWHNYLPLAFSDFTYDETFYRGVVINKPSIRESIDLIKAKSKSSNISITIPDFEYRGKSITEELTKTHSYINRVADVYTSINEGVPAKIGSFRISDISTNGFKVKISLVSHRPWDNLSIPQDRTTSTNRFFPLVYGNYTGVASSYASPVYYTDLKFPDQTVFPVEIDDYGFYYTALIPYNYGSTGVKLRYYDEGLDAFLPLEYSPSAAESYENGYSLKTEWHLRRHFKMKPTSMISKTFGSDVGNTFDDDDADENSTFSDLTISATANASAISVTKDNVFNIPTLDDAPDKTYTGDNHGMTSEIVWEYKNFLATTNGGDGVSSNSVTIYDASNTSSVVTYGTNGTFSSTASGYTTGTGSDVAKSTASHNLASNYATTGGFQEGFRMRFIRLANSIGDTTIPDDVGGTACNYIRVTDVRFKITCAIDKLNTSDNSRVTSIKKLYSNADGLTQGITGQSSALAEEIHEAHLDLLNRFCNLDVATNPATNIDGWSDLNSVRGSFDIRWWLREERNLIDVLEQMQFEGCFIFRFKQGDFSQPQYIHIPNSPSSVLTLSKADISNISLSSSSPSDIVTQRNINYNVHPAKETYQESVSATNSTSRKNFNIPAKENIKTSNLDMLVNAIGDTDPTNDDRNDSFAAYYNSLFGDVYLQVSCTIINPSKWVDSSLNPIEVGSIIDFDENNMHPPTPMGFNSADWDGLKFIITDTRRSAGNLTIKARSL